jgi:hypothetical protein
MKSRAASSSFSSAESALKGRGGRVQRFGKAGSAQQQQVQETKLPTVTCLLLLNIRSMTGADFAEVRIAVVGNVDAGKR